MSKNNNYLNYSGKPDQFTGGINVIPIKTPKGDFNVWTKRVGNNPKIKVLLLHGGPGATYELYECFDGYLPYEGIEYIYYDQLGSHRSDNPDDPSLWTIERFVDEVDQVRQALNLTHDNFYLLGQSWGGMLAMEYALAHQEHLKGLIISNMMSSVPAYNKYAKEVLGPQLPPDVLKRIQELEADDDYKNPDYEGLLMKYFYTEHVLRMPLDQWPDSVMRALHHINEKIYTYMQGPSEFGIIDSATLHNWDRSKDLPKISVPTLTVGAAHDTMDPKHMEWMAGQVQNGQYLHCPDGSHLSQYDDQKTYINGVVQFLKDVDGGKF
jgi:proline iminopeptidase